MYFVDQVTVFFGVFEHMRTRAHYRHVSQKYVDELWEFVNVGSNA